MENNISQLTDFLQGIKKMEKDFSKMGADLSANLGKDFEKIINEHMYEGEKRMKINKKEATISLAKDGSIKIVFDNSQDGKLFFEGKK